MCVACGSVGGREAMQEGGEGCGKAEEDMKRPGRVKECTFTFYLRGSARRKSVKFAILFF